MNAAITAVFVLSYALIASRRLRLLPIGRPAGALLGAVLNGPNGGTHSKRDLQCFTIIGSVANIIVAETARREYSLRFLEYLRFGVPSTVAVTAVGVAVIIFLMG